MFNPTVTNKRAWVRLQFPVEHVEFVLRDIDDRLDNEYHFLQEDLFNFVEEKLKGTADVGETENYGDLSMLFYFEDDEHLKVILEAVATACKTWWTDKRMEQMPEVQT